MVTIYPDLKKYNHDFIKSGVSYPLKKIEFQSTGLLSKLPKSNKKGWPWDLETNPGLYDLSFSWPKITIVTPSYNQGDFIEETIRAVLLQNYPNLEYIVMDGGSTDGTKEILEKYAPWISYWRSEKDKGQGHAINKGFSLASGEIYGWINSDDFYMNEAFFNLAQSFQKYNPDVIYGDGLVLDELTKNLTYCKANWVKERYLFMGGIIMQHSCFWKQSVHLPILEALHCAVDSELWFRLIPKAKIKHIKYPFGIVRIQPDAKTQNDRFKKKWEEDNALIGKIYQFEKKFFLFRYFLSRFYKYEVRFVQGIYTSLNAHKLADYINILGK